MLTEPSTMSAALDPPELRRARARALVIAAALLTIATALTVVVARNPTHPAVQGLDDAWNRWMVAHRSPAATAVARGLSFIGSAYVTWPLRLAVVALLLYRRRFVQTAAFVTATAIAELCIGPLKALIGRPRPPHQLVSTSSAAFPSGHAIAAAVTAFGLVIAFLPRGPSRLRWSALAAAFAASMALARTYLSAHWLTDTIAGACIGVGVALAIEVLFEDARTEVAEHHEEPRRPSTDHSVGRRGGVER